MVFLSYYFIYLPQILWKCNFWKAPLAYIPWNMVNRLATLSFKRRHHKMVKHTQIIRRQQPNNCLSVFDHYLGLALKGFILIVSPSETHSGKFLWKHIYLNLFISELFASVCFSFLLDTKRVTRLTRLLDFLTFLEWDIPQIKYYLYCTN